jgi:tRNA pseudouridine synthase 10
VECKGVGKLYKTSVQEIIEKPLLAATKSSKSKFSGCGREDIDARCLDWRPFVLELKKPLKRSINLKEIEKLINKSSAVKVRGLKLVDRFVVKKIKTDRLDKTYLAEVVFEKNIDKQSLRKVGSLAGQTITQKTPIRVLHRRADKVRKRLVKSISYRLLSPRKLRLKIRAESGLYIKELITGDEGRTKPNVQELLNNKVKKINLDVIKIHK